jgi:hypothetical protein
MFNYKKSKLLIIALFLLTSLVLFYFFAVPALVDINNYRGEIENRFNKRTNLPLHIEKLDMSMMMTGVRVYFTDAKIKHTDNKDFITADKGNIEISFAGLLQKKLIIKKIKINSVTANITRLSSGKFDIEQILLSKRQKGEIAVELENTKIFVNKYNLVAVDQYIKPDNRFIITGNHIKIKDFTPTKYIKLKLNGIILSNNKPHTSFNMLYASKLPLKINDILANEPVLKGQIKNLYPDIFKSYTKKYSYLMDSIKSADVRFKLNLKKSGFSPQSINADMFINSNNRNNLALKGTIKDNKLNIQNLSIKGKDINVTSSGNIENFTNNNAVLDLKILLNKIKLAEIMPFLPDNFSFLNHKIENYSANGDLKGNIIIKGKFNNPNVSGNIEFKNLNMSYKNNFNIINNTAGKVLLDNTHVILSGLEGFLGTAKFKIDGYYNNKSDYNIKTAFSNMDLGLIYNFASAKTNLFSLNREFKKISNLSGLISGVLGLSNLTINGYLKLSDVNIFLKGLSSPVDKINGIIKIVDNNIYLENIQGMLAGNLFKINGELINDYLKASISSDKLNLSTIFAFINQSTLLKKYNQQDIDKLTGSTDVKINLSGKIGENLFQNAQINLVNAAFVYKKQYIPIIITKGKFLASQDKIVIHYAKANIFNNIAYVSGQISGLKTGKINPAVKINFQNLNISSINELQKYNILSSEAKKGLNDFSGFKGLVSVKAEILPERYRINIKFNRLSALYKPLNAPLRIRSGELTITPETLKIKSLQSKISKSFLFINGQIRNYAHNPYFDLTTSLKIDSTDIGQYIDPYLDKPLDVKGKIPINTNIQGNINDFQLLAKITLDKFVSMNLPKGINIPEGQLREIIISAKGNKNAVQIINSGIIIDNDKTILNISGNINKINTPNPVFANLQIVNPDPIDITLLNPFIEPDIDEPFFSSGELKADVLLNGYLISPDITGEITLKDNIVPSRSLKINNARIKITEDKYILEESSLDIANSDMRIKADANKTFNLPIEIDNIEILSNAMNFDKVKKALEKSAGEIIKSSENSPVTVEKGKLNADEFIISNFITNNLNTSFSVSDNWLVTLPDLSVNAANGEAFGKITYNIKSQETQGDMGIKDMSANAAATTFLNISNEVYGILQGNAQFDTKGITKDELISNASGTAAFSIKDGRLTRLGSLEYLLLAANTVTIGLANINLNSILNLLIPKKTGYFDLLDGKVTSEKGVLSSDNVTTKGKNLSLLISGNINMLTNYSEVTILGRVSKRITGLLGPLGSLSINTFVEYLPGLGFIPGTGGKGLIDIIPLINKIPLLGLGKGKHRRFAVEIQGDLYDPKSVKSFRWLD